MKNILYHMVVNLSEPLESQIEIRSTIILNKDSNYYYLDYEKKGFKEYRIFKKNDLCKVKDYTNYVTMPNAGIFYTLDNLSHEEAFAKIKSLLQQIIQEGMAKLQMKQDNLNHLELKLK